MYASRTTQFVVGVFAILGVVALGYLSVHLGRVDIFGVPGYTLYANFDNISGLKDNDRVEIAGVPVGHVKSISLKDYRAHVGFFIDNGVQVDSDAIASIKTSGIIGDKYVAIQPGAGEVLRNDGVIRKTVSSFVLEDAIGQLINNVGSGSGSKSSSADHQGNGKGTGSGF